MGAPVVADRCPDGARLKLAWFGHQSNLQTIYDLAGALASFAERRPLGVTLVSAPGFGASEFCETFNHYHGRRCRMAFLPWSLQKHLAGVARMRPGRDSERRGQER